LAFDFRIYRKKPTDDLGGYVDIIWKSNVTAEFERTRRFPHAPSPHTEIHAHESILEAKARCNPARPTTSFACRGSHYIFRLFRPPYVSLSLSLSLSLPLSLSLSLSLSLDRRDADRYAPTSADERSKRCSLKRVLFYVRKWNLSIKMQTPAIIQVIRYRRRARKGPESQGLLPPDPFPFPRASSRCLVNSCPKLR